HSKSRVEELLTGSVIAYKQDIVSRIERLCAEAPDIVVDLPVHPGVNYPRPRKRVQRIVVNDDVYVVVCRMNVRLPGCGVYSRSRMLRIQLLELKLQEACVFGRIRWIGVRNRVRWGVSNP